MNKENLVIAEITVDKEELWQSIFGSAYESFEWWLGERFKQGASWEVIGEVTLTAWNPEDETKEITKSFKPDEIFEAWVKSVAEGYGHCGSTMLEIDDADACFGDVVLQVAMYGKLVWG
jgi:hypothetical protein